MSRFSSRLDRKCQVFLNKTLILPVLTKVSKDPLLIVALIPLIFHENIFKVVFDGISGKLSDFEFVEDAFTVILNFSKVACLGLEILEISDFAFKFDSSVF